jgi:nucleoside-diphosphate-sugar epimerase
MINSGNVLVTGASGFVGGQLLKRLAYRKGSETTGAVKSASSALKTGTVAVGEINQHTDWYAALKNHQVVVHTAARAHIMDDQALDPLTAFREVNVAGTVNLALQAAGIGIRRFVFISSIKVNGEQTLSGSCFMTDDAPAPEDAYGVSKFEAEQGLQQIARETDMEVVIIRPPLVYGAGVKGNFATMIKLVAKGLPLPLGSVHNKRSLVALDNLVDLIITCIDHPAAANQVFLAGDGEDLSTSELLRRVGAAMGKPAWLLPVPAGLLQLGATILGKKAMAQRLLGSLQVDIAKNREVLGWRPPVSVDEGLRRCFRNNQDG